VLAYALLVEAERLDAAQQMDGKYHFAKLIARGFNDPESLWQEHEQVRAAILTPERSGPREMTRDEWLARVASIDRRMRQAGLVPTRSGEMH
jgi:hypothetical protein